MLEIKNLYTGYEKKKDIVRNISFDVSKGEMFCIIGPNGSGKTTLLKAIGQILDYNGEVYLQKKDLSKLTRKEVGKKIGYLSQITNMYFSYSVFDCVMLGRYAHIEGLFATPKHEDNRIVNEAIELVGLKGLESKNINEISNGQLQRVLLARTIAQNPDVIMLDEPTNYLDLKYQVEILDFVKQWAIQKDKIVISVLHDLNMIQKYADNVLLLNEGNMFSIGRTKDVLSTENLKEVYDLDVKKWMLGVLELWQ